MHKTQHFGTAAVRVEKVPFVLYVICLPCSIQPWWPMAVLWDEPCARPGSSLGCRVTAVPAATAHWSCDFSLSKPHHPRCYPWPSHYHLSPKPFEEPLSGFPYSGNCNSRQSGAFMGNWKGSIRWLLHMFFHGPNIENHCKISLEMYLLIMELLCHTHHRFWDYWI